jgi:hypothetical protein
MKAKLLGAVSATALMGWVSVANAQGPMQLTEAQLDGITAGAPSAFAVSAAVVAPGFAAGTFGGAAGIDFATAHIAASSFAGTLILTAVARAR